MSEEIPVPGKVRCVNEKGEVGYHLPEAANSKQWQRSTGFKPKPLPSVENLPPVFSEPTLPEQQEEVAEIIQSEKGKPGRKPLKP